MFGRLCWIFSLSHTLSGTLGEAEAGCRVAGRFGEVYGQRSMLEGDEVTQQGCWMRAPLLPGWWHAGDTLPNGEEVQGARKLVSVKIFGILQEGLCRRSGTLRILVGGKL